MPRTRTPFAIDQHDNLYVELTAVMHPLCALSDGLPLVFFGRETKAYLPLETAIAWVRGERRHHAVEKYDIMLAVLERAQRRQGLEINEGSRRKR
jgi:hypothetical protein